MIEEKPNLNTGQPWSDLDNRDLEWNMKHKLPVDQIAEFLCRTDREVRDQAKKLGLGGATDRQSQAEAQVDSRHAEAPVDQLAT